MKKIYIFLAALMISGMGIAQYHQTLTPEQLGAKKVISVPKRAYNHNPNRTITTFTTDYAYLDDQFWGNIFSNNDAYGWDLGSTMTLRDATVTLDTLVDILSLTGFDWNNISQYTIDSVYFAIGHWNSSGQNNKFIFKMIDLGTNNYPDYNDPILWTDTLSADSNLWGQTSWLQFFYLPFAPNVTITPPTKIGLRVEFQGPTNDTGAVMAWWLNDGACGTQGYDRSTISFFYPHSYEYWDQFSTQIPTSTGGDVYYDCNQNSQYDNGVDGENFLQDIDAYFVITATECSGFNAGFTTADASCGQSDGSATCNPSGGTSPYSYQWDSNAGNQTSQTATGLAAGSYDVTVTDNDGCTQVFTATINNTNAPQGSGTAASPSCPGDCDGSIDLTVTGGTSPYTYLWSTNATLEDINGLCAGTYTVTITDSTGCISQTTVTVSDPPALVINGFNTTPSTPSCDGSATVNPGGGTPAYTYQWDDTNNQTTQTALGLCVGTYHVTVTDSKGCTVTDQVTVNAVGIEDHSLINDLKIYPNPNDGSFIVHFNNVQAGDYSFVIRDMLGQVVYSDQDVISGLYKKQINLTGYNKGVYFLSVSNGEKQGTFKIVVK